MQGNAPRLRRQVAERVVRARTGLLGALASIFPFDGMALFGELPYVVGMSPRTGRRKPWCGCYCSLVRSRAISLIRRAPTGG